jgi:hypothetical protein
MELNNRNIAWRGPNMTVIMKVEFLKQLEEQIKTLQKQLIHLKHQSEGFEKLDSDFSLMEVYNS